MGQKILANMRVLSPFNINGLHPHDVATALDYEGVRFVRVTTVLNL